MKYSGVRKHIVEQPFVFATGLAALIHSTWSLGTLFSGTQPQANDLGSTLHLIGWLIPALLISFSLDVGQIVTSAEIRAGERTWTKYATFIVFALATYYLQWIYIASHMPALELAPGIRQTWSELASTMRDAAVWIIPALLPLSTLLYTFSHEKRIAPVANVERQPVTVSSETKPVDGYLATPDERALPAPEQVESRADFLEQSALPAGREFGTLNGNGKHAATNGTSV